MSFRTPREIVDAACQIGAAKAELNPAKELVLGFLAGAFVGFGGTLAVVVGKGSPAIAAANPGLAKLLFAAVFPVGIIMLVISGSELFTGNLALITPACLSGRARWKDLGRNWALVYLGNVLGAAFVALVLVYWSGIVNGGILGAAEVEMAEAKVAPGWGRLILRAIACNWLVGMAIWLSIAADDVVGKALGLWFPIMAFAAIGFEHSIANAYFIPLGMLNGADVTVGQFLLGNLLPVTLGNMIGGVFFVGAIYCWLYADTASR